MSRQYHHADLKNGNRPETSPNTQRRHRTGHSGKGENQNSPATEIVFGKTTLPGGIVPEVVVDEDNRVRIYNTTDKPFSRICSLEMYFETYNAPHPLAGSGALIGPNVVLTCAHNLYNHDTAEEVTRVTVIPGQAALNTIPFGKIEVAEIFYPEEFVNSEHGDIKYDYAVLILEEPIGHETGWFGFMEAFKSDLLNNDIHITGYPALANVEWGTAKGMMHDAAGFRDLDDGIITHYSDSSPGTSGAALYFFGFEGNMDEPLIVGVHSGGEAIGNLYNHGPATSGQVFDDIAAWLDIGLAKLGG